LESAAQPYGNRLFIRRRDPAAMHGLSHRARLAVIVLALAAAGCASPPASDRVCAPEARPTWSVAADAGVVRTSDEFSHVLLRSDAVLAGNRFASGAVHLGQSNVEARVAASVAFEDVTDASGAPCVRVQRIAVVLRYARRDVRIAREAAADACLRREIEAHEQRHVALDDRLLKDFGATMKDRIAQLAGELSPVAGQVWSTGRAALLDKVAGATDRLSRDFSTLRRQRHRAEIDTPEEYRRARTMCDGRAQQIAHTRE
jgi:hypothetical protein